MKISTVTSLILILMTTSSGGAQESYDEEPINYSQPSLNNPIAQLQRQIDAGQRQLSFDEQHGYLKSVLDALSISPESQVLVFSKTSFQLHAISPRRPRALY